MHPSQILNTLSAFKFKIINLFDKDLNMSLKFIEDVEQWKNDLIEKTKLDKSNEDYITNIEYDAIIGNARLIFYLKQLVNKINTNPAILNKNFTESMTYGYNDTIKTRAEQYGVKQGVITQINDQDLQLSKSNKQSPTIKHIFNDLNGLNKLFGGLVQFNTNSISNPYTILLNGGGGAKILVQTPTISTIPSLSSITDFNILKQNLKQNNYNSSNIIAKLYNELINKLKTINKDIEPNDHQSIITHINSLKDKELKLNNMIAYINKYIDLYEIYGDDESSSVLSLKNMTQFLNKHDKVLNKTNVKRNNVLSIINLIAETVINKMQSTNTDKTDTHSKPQTNNEIISLFK